MEKRIIERERERKMKGRKMKGREKELRIKERKGKKEDGNRGGRKMKGRENELRIKERKGKKEALYIYLYHLCCSRLLCCLLQTVLRENIEKEERTKDDLRCCMQRWCCRQRSSSHLDVFLHHGGECFIVKLMLVAGSDAGNRWAGYTTTRDIFLIEE